MANSLNSNPKFFDTAGATSAITGPFRCKLIQWVDDNADVPDDGTLVLSINGVTLTVKVQRNTTDTPGGEGVVLWQIGPFSNGIVISSFSITTMATGNLHLWM